MRDEMSGFSLSTVGDICNVRNNSPAALANLFLP